MPIWRAKPIPSGKASLRVISPSVTVEEVEPAQLDSAAGRLDPL